MQLGSQHGHPLIDVVTHRPQIHLTVLTVPLHCARTAIVTVKLDSLTRTRS